MTEFPDGTPESICEAFRTIEERARVMMLDASKSSDVCRGYFMAVCDLAGEIEQEVKLETADAEEKHRKAGKRFLEEHGEPA